MQPHLSILHLEDDEDDVALVQQALRADQIACEIEIVSTRARFLAALERGGIDLILSDYSMPGFDGLSALRLTLERTPEVPFILVSGTLGEAAAIDSLRTGATDYVLKSHLSRLGPSVRRALSEAEDRRKRRQAEETLEKERHFLRAVLDSLEAGVLACDSEGVLTLFNRASREIHGLPEEPLAPENWEEHYELFHPDGATPLRKEEVPLFRTLQGERVRNAELKIVPRQGAARTVMASGQPIIDVRGRRLGAVVALHDVTELKQLEAQLRHAQKMEAIGRLAGGVAHDFNNLLSVIGGYSELLLDDLESGDPLRGNVVQIKNAAERAASLTRQLLAFSRKQIVEPRVLDLGVLLPEMDMMLRRLIGENIDLITRHQEELGRVKADPGQIEQIVMNLVVNARDAMPEGGRLTIETANVDLDESFIRRQAGAQPGSYVMLTVSDTGIGMDAEIQAHMFEPFFTTKEMGKGTGLGLATVYGIVKQSGGCIWVESERGRGATFRICLPRVDDPADTTGRREVAPARSGTETIMVVEDEEAFRALIGEGLRGWGYTVLEANDAGEALERCLRLNGRIDLMITDVALRGMTGPEMADRARHVNADLKVLFMSGYTDHPWFREGLLDQGTAFLQKPFALTTLARKIREVLDGGEEGAARAS